MSPWKTAYDVWLEKTNQVEPAPMTARMKWGRRLEKVIAEAYQEETGRPVVWVDETRRHPEREWQIYTPDFLCIDEPRGGDCKTAGMDRWHEWGTPGTDEIPDVYLLQNQWYLSATGLPTWDIALLVAGHDFRIYTVKEDKELQEALLYSAEKFWKDSVVGGHPPEIQHSDTVGRWLRQKFPKDKAPVRPATAQEAELIASLRLARESRKTAEQIENDLIAKAKVAIGECAGIEAAVGTVTWRATRLGRRNFRASFFR
jgi:putative phage-type endonuclease